MSTSSRTPPTILTEAAFIGIDYHKQFSVYLAVDTAGNELGKGRIEYTRHMTLPVW